MLVARTADDRFPGGLQRLKLLKPGSRLVVEYNGKRGVAHERLLLWPVTGTPTALSYVCLTPGGDIYEEALADFTRVWDVTGTSRYPDDAPSDLVQFANAPTDEEMEAYYEHGRSVAEANLRDQGVEGARAPGDCYDWTGSVVPLPRSFGTRVVGTLRRRLGMKTASSRAKGYEDLAGGNFPRILDGVAAVDGHVWVLDTFLGDRAAPGQIVVVSDQDVIRGEYGLRLALDGACHSMHLVLSDLAPVYVETVARAAAEKCGLKVVDNLTPRGAPDNDGGIDGRSLSRHSEGNGDHQDRRPTDEPPLQAVLPPEGDKDGEVRTLSVDYDAHGRRWKPWRDVAAESFEETFHDWHCEGPRTVQRLVQNYLKEGGSPTLFLKLWCRSVRVEKTDRIYHELQAWMRVLEFGGGYDQLNPGSLCCFEIAARRVQTLMEAHQICQDRPNFRAVASFSPLGRTLDGVDPALRAYGARKTKEQLELDRARSTTNSDGAQCEHPGQAPADKPTGPPRDAPVDTPKGRGRGGRGGRGGRKLVGDG